MNRYLVLQRERADANGWARGQGARKGSSSGRKFPHKVPGKESARVVVHDGFVGWVPDLYVEFPVAIRRVAFQP